MICRVKANNLLLLSDISRSMFLVAVKRTCPIYERNERIFYLRCRIWSAPDQYLSITGTGVPSPPALLSGLNTKTWLTVLPPVHLIPQKWLTAPPVSCSSHYETMADSAFISSTQLANLADAAATCHSLLQRMLGKAPIFSHTI
jgi:hypothetical protein